jgi:hypothetical protein
MAMDEVAHALALAERQGWDGTLDPLHPQSPIPVGLFIV